MGNATGGIDANLNYFLGWVLVDDCLILRYTTDVETNQKGVEQWD